MHMRRALHDDGSEGRRQEWNQAPKPEQAVAPAAEVSNSTADQPCLGTPWTTDCFTHKHVAGGDAGSGQGNFGVAAVAGQQGSPVSTTVLALTSELLLLHSYAALSCCMHELLLLSCPALVVS
jgi:hypothetical protein